MSDAIIIENLQKEYNGTKAVRGISLQVKTGEILGLVGPDGAGKTSIMRMLTGVIPITDGKAVVAGYDMRVTPEPAKSHIGYMSQQFSLYGDLTVMENLVFFADLFQVPLDRRRERVPELLKFSRLDPFVNRLAQDLSGGMKQKLALASTLIHTPDILFLDEPTTGVDPVSRRDFWQILYDLHREGVTLFVSTPYMDEAERCERVALIHQGRLLTVGTPLGLLKHMEGAVLELQSPEQRQVRRILSTVPELLSVEVFGDHIHVEVTDAISGMDILQNTLNKHQIPYENLHEISPGLEDVFVSLIRKADPVE